MENDTSPAASRRYVELLQRQSPERRLIKALSLSQTTRALAEEGVLLRFPQADERERQARLTAVLYGSQVAERLFGGGIR